MGGGAARWRNPKHTRRHPAVAAAWVFGRRSVLGAVRKCSWCEWTPDDDELIVRASAVLKSQGPENWSRGRPGPHWARTNPRSVRDISRENSGEKTAGGVASCGATGPGY